MTAATKAIAGLGGLLATAAVPSTYLVISSSGSGKETNKRSTGETWLLGSGYTPSKPAFTSQDSLKHGCSENLFSNTKDNSNPQGDSKIYGCAVMSIDIGNTGVLFQNTSESDTKTDIDPKYIKFNSEVVVRKGNEGWIINSRVDNWSSDTSALYFQYLLTTYKYDGNQWTKDGDHKLWEDPSLMSVMSQQLTATSGNDTIKNQNKLLVIKVPKETWFNSSDWVSPNSANTPKNKTKTETKSWSGVWIDDGSESSSSWIFQDIEIYMGEEKNSQIFCKGEDSQCFQSSSTSDGEPIKKPTGLDTWSQAINGNKDNTEKAKDVTGKTVKEIIGKLENSKGSWKKLEDICGTEIGESPSEEQQKQLRMYCSKGKASK